MKIRFSLLVLCSFLLIACSNKSMVRFEELSKPLQKEGFAGAIHKVQEEKDDLYGDNTKFLYHFDLATLYHYNGDYKKSADEFEKAKQVYEDLYTKSVTNEAASVVTNDNVRPYRARPFEVLALYEMNIVNYLAMKDIDPDVVLGKNKDSSGPEQLLPGEEKYPRGAKIGNVLHNTLEKSDFKDFDNAEDNIEVWKNNVPAKLKNVIKEEFNAESLPLAAHEDEWMNITLHYLFNTLHAALPIIEGGKFVKSANPKENHFRLVELRGSRQFGQGLSCQYCRQQR